MFVCTCIEVPLNWFIVLSRISVNAFVQSSSMGGIRCSMKNIALGLFDSLVAKASDW